MARLIDADKFIEYLGLDAENSREENLGEIVTLEDFDRQPTVENKSLYYGKWIDVSECLPNEDEEYFPVIVKGIIDGGMYDGEEIICKGFGKYIDWERAWKVEISTDTKIYPRKVLAWFRTPVYELEEDEYGTD